MLLLLIAPVWSGDAEVARFLYQKAQRAYRAKKYDEAEKGFRRAVKEDSPFPEASYALGLALEKLARPVEAIAAYQQCLDAAAGDDAPRKWRSIANRAGRAIGRLRRRFAALAKINSAFIKRCLAFGRKHSKTDPDWARKAFETVLKIDPGNQAARNHLAVPSGGKKTAPTKPVGGAWKPLIVADEFGAWSPGETNEWSILGPVITGDVVGRDGKINWLDNLEVDGKYSVRFRFRVVTDRRDRRTVGFFIGDAKDYWWSIMLDEDNELVLVRFSKGKSIPARERAVGEFDPSRWHTVLVEARGREARVFLDGKKVFEHIGERKQKFAGKFGFFVQNAKVEFKELELKR